MHKGSQVSEWVSIETNEKTFAECGTEFWSSWTHNQNLNQVIHNVGLQTEFPGFKERMFCLKSDNKLFSKTRAVSQYSKIWKSDSFKSLYLPEWVWNFDLLLHVYWRTKFSPYLIHWTCLYEFWKVFPDLALNFMRTGDKLTAVLISQQWYKPLWGSDRIKRWGLNQQLLFVTALLHSLFYFFLLREVAGVPTSLKFTSFKPFLNWKIINQAWRLSCNLQWHS